MIAYKYKALDKEGKQVTGIVEAYDEFEAVEKIKETCNVVLKIDEIKDREESKLKERLNEPMKLNEKNLSLIASQFAILLKSGLAASRTVEIIANQTNDKYNDYSM